MDVDDFSFLWGPIWLVDSMIRTERGFIVAVEPSNTCKKEEIECHFGTEIPRCHIRKTLSATSRILIGSNHHIYTVNRDCPTIVESVEDWVASELQLLGTSASGYDSGGYTLGANAGKYATATLNKSWKKRPGRTQKDVLFDPFKLDSTDLLPHLKLKVGLEVSICTGNATRTTLWDALCLSFIDTTKTGWCCAIIPSGMLIVWLVAGTDKLKTRLTLLIRGLVSWIGDLYERRPWRLLRYCQIRVLVQMVFYGYGGHTRINSWSTKSKKDESVVTHVERYSHEVDLGRWVYEMSGISDG